MLGMMKQHCKAAFSGSFIALGLSALLAAPIGATAAPVSAKPTVRFLNSIGVVTTFPDRGQPLPKTIEMINYAGFRWVRAGIEGLTEDGPTTIQTFLELHKETGVKFSWGLLSGSADLDKLIATAKVLVEADALLAFEGNNEPNNWGVTYQGEEGGGRKSWLPVAKLQRDLYKAVKGDPVLASYPVWSISEPGAQTDNVGLQFLAIPDGAAALMPAGTQFADYANVHNYIYHPRSPVPADNKTWNAADPGASSNVDGLYGNFGVTWSKGFPGYSEEVLANLPRVTTETGAVVEGRVTEYRHAVDLLNMYFAQFRRGYAYTSVYLLRDRTDEDGTQTFGFFRPDYMPRKAAVFLHNTTRILSETHAPRALETLDYAILDRPITVHDLLLQNADNSFALIVWGERLTGEEAVTVRFAKKPKSITVFDPTSSSAPVAVRNDTNEIVLVMGDHPYILRVSP